jgi:hypothetical protein
MGCFNEHCGLTGAPITYEMPIRMMAVRYIGGAGRGVMRTSPISFFEPISLLVRGKYNDYGWIDFEEGENERFFDSLNKMGVNVEDPGESSDIELPQNVFLWFCREDAFQMIDQIKVEVIGETEFLYPPIAETRAPAFEAFRAFRKISREHLDAVIAKTADDASYDRNFEAEEAVRRHLSDNHYNLRTSLMVKARNFKNDEEAEQALIDLFDLERVTVALGELRRPLVPHICGGQGYDDAAHKLVAAFVAGLKNPYQEDE